MRARARAALERVRSGGEQRVEIAEEHHGHVESGALDESEDLVEGHALREGALRAPLNDRTIRHRVGERYADLDDVGAGVLHGLEQLQRAGDVRMSGGDVHDERLAPVRSQ